MHAHVLLVPIKAMIWWPWMGFVVSIPGLGFSLCVRCVQRKSPHVAIRKQAKGRKGNDDAWLAVLDSAFADVAADYACRCQICNREQSTGRA